MTNADQEARRRAAKSRTKQPMFVFGAVQIWYVDPFDAIDQPVTFFKFSSIPEVTMLTGSHEKARKTIIDSLSPHADDIKIIEVHGVEGLASTDPTWDMRPTFRCDHCAVDHDVHEAMAVNLYRQRHAHMVN